MLAASWGELEAYHHTVVKQSDCRLHNTNCICVMCSTAIITGLDWTTRLPLKLKVLYYVVPYSRFLSRGINNRVRWYVVVLKSAVFNAPLLIVK